MHRNAGRGSYVHADFRGIVDPDFVFDDLGIETSVAELLGNVVGRSFVFGRAGHVRCFRERAQVLFCELGIRDSEKPSFDCGFGGGVAKAEDGLGIIGPLRRRARFRHSGRLKRSRLQQ